MIAGLPRRRCSQHGFFSINSEEPFFRQAPIGGCTRRDYRQKEREVRDASACAKRGRPQAAPYPITKPLQTHCKGIPKKIWRGRLWPTRTKCRRTRLVWAWVYFIFCAPCLWVATDRRDVFGLFALVSQTRLDNPSFFVKILVHTADHDHSRRSGGRTALGHGMSVART